MYLLTLVVVLLLSYALSRRKTKYRKILIIASGFACAVYAIWRFFTIPINSGPLSFMLGFILFSAEMLGLIAFFNFKYLFIKKYKLEYKSLENFDDSNIPNVDVLICTYNEPLNLLEKTIAACTNLEYPDGKSKIYVCDDGKREDLRKLCKSYNVNYITRNDNEGAKAGNINNALKYLEGDLFAILDADMIPKKEFLLRTVGYFSNENVAFVQTPQVYYNQDMYQYNLSKNMPNEQDFFMRDIQEARAAQKAVLHVGTNALFRREYVEEIGGYPTCSITEDMAVGMLLQSKGYDSVLVNEELVLGLSATIFSDLVKQRDRWCRGNIQVLRHFNPLFTKGLSLGQKIAYFDGGVYWFSNLQKLIYIACPIIYLLTANVVIDAQVSELLNIYIPFVLGQILIFKSLSTGNRNLSWSHLYEVAMAPHISLSILKEMLSLKTKFNVTSKEVCNEKKQFQMKVAMPHVFIIIITIVAWVISAFKVINCDMNISAYFLNMVWSIYNLAGSIVSIKVAYQKPIFRASERIMINEKINVECDCEGNKFNAEILDISERGIGLKVEEGFELKEGSQVKLNLSDTLFNCNVARINNKVVGLRYNDLSARHMKLIMNIFVKNMKAFYGINKEQEYMFVKKAEV